MNVPYSLLVIKPNAVGIGEAPRILNEVLDKLPVSLRFFRSSFICDTSWKALSMRHNGVESTLNYEVEKLNAVRPIVSWVCIITHIDRVTDPTDLLNNLFGPIDPTKRTHKHLRTKYNRSYLSDSSIAHISVPERVEYEASVLLVNFNELNI